MTAFGGGGEGWLCLLSPKQVFLKKSVLLSFFPALFSVIPIK